MIHYPLLMFMCQNQRQNLAWLTLNYDEWMCAKKGVFLLFLLILFWIVVLKGIWFVDFGFLQAHCTQE